MTVLIISPDYVSHYNPLSVLANAAASEGCRVVVATGPGLRAMVEADGHQWHELRLGPAANAGVAADDPAIQAFINATAAGPLDTIRHQAIKRERDLLWQPEQVLAEIAVLVDRLDPEHVLVDHVSFASTLGLYATGRPFTTLVPGHPSQLPVGVERYGIPGNWPTGMQQPQAELGDVQRLADRVTGAFTDRWNQALATAGSDRPPVEDAFRVHGERVLFNSVNELADPERLEILPPNSRFVGPLVRRAGSAPVSSSWLERDKDLPQVYVGFGTFLSHRGDVLARVADGLRQAGVRAAIAAGPNPVEALGPIPSDWLVAPILPQVDLLSMSDLVIHHGGNNSVQESLAARSQQIVMPFSTDQFANAADLERIKAATVLPPNTARAEDIATAIKTALAKPSPIEISPMSDSALARALLDPSPPPIV